jgi:hypothetical protein
VLVLTALLALSPAASASMQLVVVDEPTPVKTFHTLHGINMSAENDAISVTQSGSEIVMLDQVGISGFPADCHRQSPTIVACPASGYDDFAFFTGAGNDSVTIQAIYPNLTIKQIFGPSVAVFMNATLGPGNDTFVGGNGTNAAAGGAGRDRMIGGPANDLLNGNQGSDHVSGGGGVDELFGNAGRDRITAGPGVPDLMVGGKGRDSCIADEGKDLVAGCERVRL